MRHGSRGARPLFLYTLFLYKPGDWGASTCAGTTVYLHIFNMTGGALTLPPLTKKILKSELLTGGKATVKQDDSGLTISIPASDQQDIDTIVKLEVDKPAFDIAPVSVTPPASAK